MSNFLSALLVLCLVAMFSLPAHAVDTEAEKAAQSERAITKAEATRLKAGCENLFTHRDEVLFTGDGFEVRKVLLKPQHFLKVIFYKTADKKTGQEKISKAPDLPKGGIGTRDLCGGAVFWSFPPRKENALKSLIALRLRPELDIKEHYPTAFQQISRFDQIINLEAREYGLVVLKDGQKDTDVISNLSNADFLDVKENYFSIGRYLFLPLKR